MALALVSPGPSSARGAEEAAADQPAGAKEKSGAGRETVVKMQEVLVFEEQGKEKGGAARYPVFGGQYANCSATPNPGVKAYPKLNSKRPLYGSVLFRRDPSKPSAAAKFDFVLDQSHPPKQPEGEQPAASEGAKARPPEGEKAKALPEKPGSAPAGDAAVQFEYDRLYLDANRDLDLTNDPPIALKKEIPPGLPRPTLGRTELRVFDYVSLSLDDDPAAKGRPVRLLPMFTGYQNRGYLTFMPASLWKGEVRVGEKTYEAILAPSSVALGRFDQASTMLFLHPAGAPQGRRSYGGFDTLGTVRQLEGELYTFSATPSGDQLTLRPYAGDCGVFEVSAGGRELKKLGVAGILRSKDSMFPLGPMTFPVPSEKLPRHKLPVGDYYPVSLSVDYGPLTIALQPAQAFEDRTGQRQARPPQYSVAVCKEKPFVLDFSGKPAVTFVNPPKEQTFKPGDQVRIEAMLVDPASKMMIRGLQDTTRKIGELKYLDEDGKPLLLPRYASLDPTVVITDSSGKRVAEGIMPFG